MYKKTLLGNQLFNLNLTMANNSSNNGANEYNRIKAIVFSTYHNKGINKALEYLEGYKKRVTIDNRDYRGLKAEINFYNKYRTELVLDPIWDYGIKCDFVGNIEGSYNVRLDVTTNLDFKSKEALFNLNKATGRLYKFVRVNPDNGDIREVIDYFNPAAKKAVNRYNLALFMPGDRDKNNPYIEVYSIAIDNPYEDVQHVDTITDFYIPDIRSVIAEIPDDMDENEVSGEIEKYCTTVAKMLNNHYGIRVDALGQHCCNYYDLDSKYIKIYWRHPALKDDIEETYEGNLEDVYW